MTLREHLRKNILLATPVMVGQLGHIMVSVADSVMVGRVGVIPLAASTFAGTFFYVLMLFGIGVSYAITPVVAATDRSDKPRLLSFLQSGLMMNVVLGIILLLLGLLASNFLEYFGQQEQVVQAGRPYLVIVSLSLFPIMIFQTFRQFSEGQSDTLSPMIVSIVANLLNVGLNYLLIYGKFGFEPMGLNGAGIATLISRIAMALLIVWLIRKKCQGFKWKFDPIIIKRLLKIGVPSGMQYIFEVGAFATAAIMVGWISAEALAAHNIALNLSAITYMAATGLAAAATIRVGNQVGLKDKRNLRVAGFSIMALVTVFMAICGILLIIFRGFLPALYIEDLEVKSIASALIIIAAAYQIPDGLQAVGLGVLRGLTDVKIPTIVTFVSFWIIAIPLGYFLAFPLGMGVNGVWYGLCVGLTLASIFHIWRFNRLTNQLEFD
ncbi:MAG: MATE family efflux transporter [Cyclobacteriaceae bacterium]